MTNRVFVGNLPFDADWKYLKDLFRDAGIDVLHADVVMDSKTQMSKGWAIVEVATEFDVELAVEALNQTEVDGRSLNVREDREPRKGEGKSKGKGKEKAKGKGTRGMNEDQSGLEASDFPRPSSQFENMNNGHHDLGRNQQQDDAPSTPRIVVENLPLTADWKLMKDTCRELGLDVRRADIVKDPNTKKCIGMATVELSSVDEAMTAIEVLNGHELEGRQLHAREDTEHHDLSGGAPHQRVDFAGAPAVPSQAPPLKRARNHNRRPQFNAEPQRERTAIASRPDQLDPPMDPMRNKRPLPSDGGANCRLFCENLSPTVTWKQLKEFFQGYVNLEYANVVDTGGAHAYGVVEFASRADALEACMTFNGLLLEGRPIRLRQDRGEFENLRSQKRQAVAIPQRVAQTHPSKQMPPWKDGSIASGAASSSRGDGNGGGGDDAKYRRAGSSDARVFVGNLDFRATWQVLKDHMRQAGEVRFCDVMTDVEGRSKGYALVEYATSQEAMRACKMLHDTVVLDRAILVKPDEDRMDRGNR
eukprot:TRINITY_DN1205_c0_g1_i1.p1 TRINITY_DN1205_c0_g1~~TRINITY_DN1205_c0_g1_i1.p1  ORF type:complete len:532 (-),score=101.51 TRINITY_DN1205_c0_g1_i1:96-1691(-)